ncbi:MAG: hypothetical protein PUE08_00875 [Eubacteriales bacterium]|nr:hypothetical protein [Eubacteriales bacterium]
MQKRKIKDLLNPDYYVYVSVHSKEMSKRFVADAKSEGFTLDCGKKCCTFVLHDDMTVTGADGYVSNLAYRGLTVNDGKIVVRIDYEKYISGEENYFTGKIKAVDSEKFAQMQQPKKEHRDISQGTAAFLVREKNMQENEDILKWLEDNGFELWEHSKGWYKGVDWMYINVNSKVYARGIPGIKLTQSVGKDSLTFDEFKMIYNLCC